MERQIKKNKKTKEFVKQKLRERKKASKKLLKEKRARLIIKNLPFKATEENLKEHFGQYGEIVNIDLLKKSDGKLIGCAFIQFKLVQKAAKARHHINGEQFMGRELIVDFAKSKDKYKKENIKTESKPTEVKEEPIDVDEIDEKIDSEKDKVETHSSENSDNESVESGEESDDGARHDETEEADNSIDKHKPHVISNDITEGKTIFVKNVPFQATKDDLKQCMLQFGQIYYSLICIDKLTEHSKGTAFVKFVNKEDAEKALNAGTELTLMGNVLDCHPALGREEVQKQAQLKKLKEPKDSRSLYLVKEGVILAGTKAAEGVSASDMAKRLQIEQYKTQMLRNLNMFVSKIRLVVHNLPPTWDDKKFRMLLEKYGGSGAVVKEARIMRDMKNIDANGIGKSKEYGFVAFTKHESALAALRTLNNNPNIFSPTKRPIITFSIENKKMINAKLKRLEKSKVHNPTHKHFSPKDNKNEKKSGKISRKEKHGRIHKQERETSKETEDNIQHFSGVTAKPGTKEKMRSRYKLSVQAKLHYENLKKEKRKKKNMKKPLGEKKQDFIKQPKQKIHKKAETDNFSKLVNQYKKQLSNAISSKKSKWYE